LDFHGRTDDPFKFVEEIINQAVRQGFGGIFHFPFSTCHFSFVIAFDGRNSGNDK